MLFRGNKFRYFKVESATAEAADADNTEMKVAGYDELPSPDAQNTQC